MTGSLRLWLLICLVCLHCSLPTNLTAASGNYAVQSIPEALLKDASLVKRVDDCTIRISRTGKAKVVHHYAYTVYNEEGRRFAKLNLWYDKFHPVDYIKGALYDAAGLQLKTLSSGDVSDNALFNEGLFASDTRVRTHEFYCRNYPFTVEYEVAVDYRSIMFLPAWSPIEHEFVSVQESRLDVTFPSDYLLRYRAVNNAAKPELKEADGSKTLSWSLINTPAILKEPYSPAMEEIMPCVYLAPSAFSLADYQGSMSSWQQVGAFISLLNQGLDQLPEGTRQQVHSLTDTVADKKKKVALLYQYLQANTHYVNLQFGIGGWQPCSAALVAVNHYGDCKALSNFMNALLREAGIPSYYCLIKAGVDERYFIPDFPFSPFNHAIVCVPIAQDTIWLECTSQTLSPGYLSRFTGNRPALIISGDKSTLVHTPSYGSRENILHRETKASFAKDGLVLENQTRYQAGEQDYLHSVVNDPTPEKKDEWFKHAYDFADGKFVNAAYVSAQNGVLPEVTESLKLVLTDIQPDSKRIFIPARVYTNRASKPVNTLKRNTPIAVNDGYTFIDSFVLSLPEFYTIETMPPAVDLHTRFGHYESHNRVEGSNWICYTSYVMNDGIYPPSDYEAFMNFKEEVFKATKSRLVLIRKDGH